MALYFVALIPPEENKAQVLEWKHYMRDAFGCKVALKSPAHITLIPPFESKQEVVLPKIEFQPFTVYLKNFNSFESNVIFVDVLPNEELQQLRERVVEIMHAKKESRFFHPHITIANRDLKQADFPKAWKHFNNLTYETSFLADKISLLKHNGQHWVIVN